MINENQQPQQTSTTMNTTGPTPVATPSTTSTVSSQNNSDQITSAISSNTMGDSVKLKQKINIRFIIGAIVLLLVIIGAAAGYYLVQYSQDIRQQAYIGQTCTYSEGCSGAGEICVKPDGSACNGASGCTCKAPTVPAYCNTLPVDGFTSCPTECKGVHRTVACTDNYTKWICGNKNWIPDYGDPNNGEGCSDCPWDLTGGVCCPKGVDACNPDTDNYKCVADPYVSHCEEWSNTSCPANQQGYWKAIAWCSTPGCECGPNGLFSDYSGPGCECGGGGLSCNDQCSTNADCTAVNSNWACVTASDGFKRCRLASNPDSTSCQPGGGGGGGLNCNDSCTSDAQCEAENPNWFCEPSSNKCRLESNPSSTTCEPGGGSSLSCVSSNLTTPVTPVTNPPSLLPGQSATFSSTASAPVNNFWYLAYNKENLYPENGTPKPVCVTTGGDTTSIKGNCPGTSYQLTFKNPNTTLRTASGTITRTYEQIFVVDKNWGDKQVNSVQFNAYMNITGQSFTPPVASCVESVIKSATTTEKQCDSTCIFGANFDQCTQANPLWSCQIVNTGPNQTGPRCRLTTNPSSPTCQPATTEAPMCKDVAILDKDNNELDPKAVPSSFFIGQVIKLRCAADNPTSSLIQKYQFRITEPSGKVVEGTTLNPPGNAITSLEYQINESGQFKAQCRICLTDGTCQAYKDIQ